MATRESDTPKKDQPQLLDLSNLPENSRVRIHVDQMPAGAVEAKNVRRESSPRSIGAIVGGAIGAVIGYAGSFFAYNAKMSEFEADVAARTKGAITRSVGAGLSEGMGGMGVGMSAHQVEHGIYAELAKDTKKYGTFPKKMWDMFRTNGKSATTMAGAAVVGTVGAVVAYNMMPEKKPEGQPEDWVSRVESGDKDKSRSV
ncbi:MAG: hypothetical protein EBV03_06535 [Proteobacteria bacterium]|nr:hypothetical protein [Pseudomonadota bacterium]